MNSNYGAPRQQMQHHQQQQRQRQQRVGSPSVRHHPYSTQDPLKQFTQAINQMPGGLPIHPQHIQNFHDDPLAFVQQQWEDPNNGGGGGHPQQYQMQQQYSHVQHRQQQHRPQQQQQYHQPQHHHHGGGGALGMQPQSQQAHEKPTGLRHFSTKVCEKVKEKGLTNYNEVADELVADYFQNNIMKQIDVVKQEYDMKNIRRRVYDALNVLLAMNIITKNKKDIRWIGLPASAQQEISRLEDEKSRRENSIRSKKLALQQMVMQIVCYKNLIARNRKNEHTNGRPDPESLLHLPFLVINTDRETNVECSVSADKSEFLFSFDRKFDIHDDFEILKKLKLTSGLDDGSATEEQIAKAKKYLPKVHQHYVDDIIRTKKAQEAERAERKKREMEHQRYLQQQLEQQMQQQQQQQQSMGQTLYYDDDVQHQPQQQQQNPGGRFNRQLQEHLMHDGSEDRSAAAGIIEEDMMVDQQKTMAPPAPPQNPNSRAAMYTYSPPKFRHQQMAPPGRLQAPSSSRRYYVQKPVPGQPKQHSQREFQRDISPLVRHQNRPYPATQQIQQGRLVPAGSGNGGPVKYYIPPSGQQSQPQPTRYIQRVRPPPPVHMHHQQQQMHQPQQQQRVVYTNSNGTPIQLAPGQRIVTQRIVTPGQTPGTVVRKVIRKIVMNNNGGSTMTGIQKQSPAQQVIQRKLMEQEMKSDQQHQQYQQQHHQQQVQHQQHRNQNQQEPMTSAQAAALIQHPPVDEFNYFQ